MTKKHPRGLRPAPGKGTRWVFDSNLIRRDGALSTVNAALDCPRAELRANTRTQPERPARFPASLP